MPSTTPKRAARHTSLPRLFDHTKAFAKDWVRLSHSGAHDLRRLKEAMMLLIANSGPLPAEWLDHPLSGEWADHRELHAKGDLLLIYRIDKGSLIFVRSGTHSELFGR